MNLESSSINSFIFTKFKELAKEKPYLKLGPYAEISLKIFQELSQQDLTNARGVCKEWKQLIEQTNRWRSSHPKKIKSNLPTSNQLAANAANSLDPSPPRWSPPQIAKFLWCNPATIISDSEEAKVNAVAAYLYKEGFELKGVVGDGDCFFSAFLGSYEGLSRKISLLAILSDKISYLRQVLSGIVKHRDSKRAEEIIGKRTWVSGLGEGDLLASALSIPIRLVTVNEERLICGINDMLIFPKASLSEEDRSQEWKAIPQEERPQEYIFIVDLGGHFIYAQKPLKQDNPLLSKSITSPDILFSNSLSTNKLKNTLETLESQELLLDEKIKELEKTYTQALQIAIQEKDLIQESFCIEKLGDIYLRKQTSETLLQAAGLYNYALRLAPPQRQEILKDKLCQVQNLLVKQCKGKTFDFVIIEKQFENNRNKLKKFREKIEKKIQTLPENPPSLEVRELYHEIARQIKFFFGQLVIQAVHQLDTAPCEYAMIGFGSLAREEMTPYSDLEFGILIQEENPINKKYFRNLTNLLHLQVINLGETILSALNIPCLKAINFFDSVTPRGFTFDGIGIEGKGCKTPLGNGKTFELIQTPEQMAQYVSKDEKGQWWHEKEPHLPMELLNFTHLLGNVGLTKDYDEQIQEMLNTSYQENVDLRQYLAKEHLVLVDIAAFDPGMGDLDRHGILFKVKNDLYRFPHVALDRLVLLKKIAATETFTRIDKLSELKVITKRATEKLKEWMSLVLFMRLKTYSHYEVQKEMMNPLLKPFGFEDAELIQQQFALDPTALKNIKKTYRTFIPFYHSIHEFLAGNEDKLTSSDLEDDSPEAHGDIHRRLFQHKKAEKWYILVQKANPQNARVLNALAIIYYEQGNLKQATEYINKAHAINLKLFGENHPHMASGYNNLGQIYQGQGKLQQAAEYTNKALAIDFKLFGEYHPNVVRDYNNLGQIYQEQGNLGQAEEHIRKALAIDLKLFGDNYPMVAIDYNNLGMIYQKQGNLGKAAEYINKSLAINLKLFGEYHPHVAINYSNIGLIYKKQGNLDQAEEYINKALAIDLKLFGEKHSTTSIDYSNIGLIYQERGNLGQAEEHIRKALAINLKLFGENYPMVAINYNKLGLIYHNQGNLDQAAQYIKKALIVNLKLFGEYHPTVAAHCNTLGQIYREGGNLDKAAEYINKALAIDLKLFGENHPEVTNFYNNLGGIYQSQGNLDKAAEYINKALAINLKLFGETHPNVARDYNNLGMIYQKQGNLGKAEEYTNKALAIDLKLFGEDHPHVAIIYSNIGLIYKKQGNLDQAEEYINKALAIDLKLFGENHSTAAVDYSNIGLIYQERGNLGQAEEHIRKALAINLKLFGENYPTVAIDYSNLGAIYHDQGNLGQAEEYINKALAIDLRLFGEHHSTVATHYNNLGLIYKKQGNLDKAAVYINEALAIDFKFFGENHPAMAIDYSNLGAIYHDQGNLGQAEEYINKALAIDLRLFGEHHSTVATNYNNLGLIYKKQGNLDKAAVYINKALAIDLKLFGENHHTVVRDYNNLGQIYQDQGNLEKAAKYFKKTLEIAIKLFNENHPLVVMLANKLKTISQGDAKKFYD
jgi:tetratricopeptide (TPR) repeat protein